MSDCLSKTHDVTEDRRCIAPDLAASLYADSGGRLNSARRTAGGQDENTVVFTPLNCFDNSEGIPSDTHYEKSGQQLFSSDVFKKVVADVKAFGITNPETIDRAVARQMADNQVLGFAEFHDNPNALMEYGATMMHNLAQQGATHLVVEAFGNPDLAKQ